MNTQHEYEHVISITKKVSLNTENVKSEFASVVNIMQPESAVDLDTLKDSIANVCGNKTSPYYPTLSLYCAEQVKHCNSIVETLSKEKTVMAQLQALGSEMVAQTPNDLSAMPRWKVFRLRLSDLIATCSAEVLDNADVKPLVDDVDKKTLEIFFQCRAQSLGRVANALRANLLAFCEKASEAETVFAFADALLQENTSAAMKERWPQTPYKQR